ncbi:MAG: AMP-binding protein [Peptococcaceae bacterium]|nr:AMP-binding protein [Peptococcaceae bacterium]
MLTIEGLRFDTFLSPSELIDYSAAKYTTAPAVTFHRGDQTIQKTYLEFQENIRQLASHFSNALQPNLAQPCHSNQACPTQPPCQTAPSQPLDLMTPRLCLIGEPSYEWLVSFYAASYAGFVSVLIDYSLGPADIIDHIDRAEPAYILFDERSAFCQGVNRQTLENYAAQHQIPMLGFADFDKVFEENAARAASFERVRVLADDVAVVVYTSGTTGKSKGVMLSNVNLMSSLLLCCFGSASYAPILQATLAALPFHHMFQLTAGIQCPLYYGLNICIGKGVKYFSRNLKVFQPSLLVLVPLAVELISKVTWAGVRSQNKERPLRFLMALANGLLKVGIDVRKRFFKSLRAEFGGNLATIIVGGAPLDDRYVKEFRTWGINIYIGYGITECSPVVASNRPQALRKSSVGQPMPVSFYDVKIVNGEILVRGDIVMKGYYNDPQRTLEAFADGWFRTGDLGHLDKRGFLYVTGRMKNLIILPNGENVSPEELENVFISVEGIKDILITERTIGSSIILAAIIVPEEDLWTLGEEALGRMFESEFARLNTGLPGYKRVYRIEIRLEEFIKSSSAKIKRIKENYEPWKPKL